MLDPSFFISFASVSNKTLAELKNALLRLPRKSVGDVRLRELANIRQHPNGAYLFYSDLGCLEYVGKSTSRIFIDRIPAHFDCREDAWLNSLPKHIQNQDKCTLSEAVDRALLLEILIIGCDPPLHGGLIESVLRGYLKPRLNKTEKAFDDNLTFNEACNNLLGRGNPTNKSSKSRQSVS